MKHYFYVIFIYYFEKKNFTIFITDYNSNIQNFFHKIG